jgi:hypothetical protein
MTQVEKGELPFDRLPTAANDVQVFPTMQGPLIGCGKLATNGCGIWFDNEKGSVVSGATKDKIKAIIATSGDDLLLAAPFDNKSLTWKTTVQPPRVVPVENNVPPPRVVPVANNVHRLRTKEQLCDYLHRAASHPVKKTWLAAIKAGEYATWPGLTYELVSNHLYDTEETTMGHLHKRRQNIRSTKPKPVQNTVEDLEPELQGQFFIKKNRTKRAGVHLIGMEDLNGMISTDQTGRFPVKSLKGKSYIMVLYNYDSNVILAETMKSRKAPDLVAAYNKLHQQLLDGGVKPVLQRLDNEISRVLIKAIKDKGIDYQLASPHDHQLNPAERAIQTFKNHLISILHGTDNKFPAWLWCQIIPQVIMTLNMLRCSRINPKLSAYTQIFGVFDYNQTPLAPIGTRTVVHQRTAQHARLNRIQAIVPISALYFWVLFLRGHISLKNWTYFPLLRESATPFKSTCFLIESKKRRLLCMGRTYATKRRTLLKIGNKQFERCKYRCGFEPGTCKSTRRGAEFYFTYLENESTSKK